MEIAKAKYFVCWDTNDTIDKLKSYKEKNMNEDNYQETLETKAFGYTVDDIIFTNDTGWIRIINKLWDCYAKEHVYEGIGILNKHEYKDIRHHNVTGKMQLGHSKHCKDVDDVRYVNSITDDIKINQITNKVSVIKFKPDVCDNEIELQLGDYEIEVRYGKTYVIKKKPKYPTTYEECCEILGIGSYFEPEIRNVTTEECYKFTNLIRLKRCRNVYWKIYGEEMGLDKPWEPDLENEELYCIQNYNRQIIINRTNTAFNKFLIFPTEEMRDVFYENFKDLIEQCKELL